MKTPEKSKPGCCGGLSSQDTGHLDDTYFTSKQWPPQCIVCGPRMTRPFFFFFFLSQPRPNLYPTSQSWLSQCLLVSLAATPERTIVTIFEG